VLSEVTPGGRAVILTQGYARALAADTGPLRLSLRAICATIAPGSRLRLSLAGASFPAHPVNPGSGTPPAAARMEDARVITLSIAHGGTTPSCLHLPWTDLRPPLSTSALRSLHP